MADKKTFKKLSETSFQLDEVKSFSNKVNCIQIMQQLTAGVNQIKQMVWQAIQGKAQVKQVIAWYNSWVDVLAEAKEKVKLAIAIPEKINFGKDFDVTNIDLTKLPKIDIKLGEPKEEKKIEPVEEKEIEPKTEVKK